MPDAPVHGLKIEYRSHAAGGAYAVLADETDVTLTDRISGFQPRMTASPLSAEGFGASGTAEFDNGNKKWVLSFVVERQHDDEGAALDFITEHAATVGSLGNFDLKITSYAQTTYLVDCAITELTPDPASDQSSKIRYAFAGPVYTNTDPDS